MAVLEIHSKEESLIKATHLENQGVTHTKLPYNKEERPLSLALIAQDFINLVLPATVPPHSL